MLRNIAHVCIWPSTEFKLASQVTDLVLISSQDVNTGNVITKSRFRVDNTVA